MATPHPENNRVHSVAVETEGLLLQLDEQEWLLRKVLHFIIAVSSTKT